MGFERLLRHERHTVNIQGIPVIVEDHVFSPDPDLTRSSSIIIEHLPDLNSKKVLDLGSGTGAIALHCSARGAASVIAADISQEALKNIEKNITLNTANNIEVRLSNLFDNIPEKFDYIFANLPILDTVWDQNEGTAENIIEKFLNESPNHLLENGKAYLACGSFADITPIEEALRKTNYTVTLETMDAIGYTWTLFILS